MRAEHKRLTSEDKFGRKYYCQHAACGLIRSMKHANSKKLRRIYKEECRCKKLK